MSDWTKIDKVTETSGAIGWGDLAWGDGEWGSPGDMQWTKITKTTASWTKIAKVEDTI